MSYSFTIRAADKAEAKSKIAKELTRVVRDQPTHALDQPTAQATANAYVDMLADDPAQTIQVSVAGSLGWSDFSNVRTFQRANVNISAGLTQKSSDESTG